ncbi:MAG: hypothetical protein H8D77_02360 [Chloroflexi bacterium]|nr:hypothetical protein [Chloroflexota bacterium]
MTHPALPACLITAYSSKPSQKGGTLIAEDVVDLADHRRRLWDPDAYRPSRCFHCDSDCLHAHDFRARLLRGDPLSVSELIRRYRCASCRGVWQVLPAVICRHLHRRWEVVQSAVAVEGAGASQGGERRRPVPRQTVIRWLGRLMMSALMLTQALAGAGAAVVDVIGRVGMDCTRGGLVDALAASGVVQGTRKLEQLAGWIHRLAPGVRLM